MKTLEKTKNLEKLSTLEILELIQPDLAKIKYDGGEIYTGIINITPEIAKIFLSRNIEKNRPIDNNNVNIICKAIEKGKWAMTTEMIKFDEEGRLIDGQNRLSAIIKSNKKVQVMFSYGIKIEAFGALDTGRKRTGSDVLAMRGVKNSTLAAATVRLVNQFQRFSYGEGGAVGRTLSNQDIYEIYKSDEQNYEHSVSRGQSLRKECSEIISPSIIASFHYLMSKKSKEQAEEFLTKLCTGIDLQKDSPITALRNKLIKSKSDRNFKMIQSEIVRNVIYSWNKFRNNEKAKNIKISSLMGDLQLI